MKSHWIKNIHQIYLIVYSCSKLRAISSWGSNERDGTIHFRFPSTLRITSDGVRHTGHDIGCLSGGEILNLAHSTNFAHFTRQLKQPLLRKGNGIFFSVKYSRCNDKSTDQSILLGLAFHEENAHQRTKVSFISLCQASLILLELRPW